MSLSKTLAIAFAALYAAAMFDAAVAQRYQGIMVEEPGSASKRGAKKEDVERPAVEKQAVQKKRPRPRGSSTYIPPPVPSPYASPAPAAAPSPGVYIPPKLNTFSDRVTNCIHSFPLNSGIGNNPTERNAYVRQCAN